MADRATLLMIVAYLAGLGMLAYELQNTPSPPEPPPEQAMEALPPLELPPVAISSIAIYDAVIERPLFNADRRPDEVEASPTAVVAAAGPVDEIDGYRLAAVIKGYGTTTALIEDRSGNTQTLRPGDKLGRWALQEIQDDRVVLHSDQRQEILLVYKFDPVILNNEADHSSDTRRPTRRPQRPPVALVPNLPESPEKPNL